MTECEALEQVLSHATGEAHSVIKRMITARKIAASERRRADLRSLSECKRFIGARLP